MTINNSTEISEVQTFKNGTKHLRVSDKKSGRFLRYERQVDDDPTMFFGKYKGWKFSEIMDENENYFDWILKQDWLKDNLKNTILHFQSNYDEFR